MRFFCVTRRRRQIGVEYEIHSSPESGMVNPHRPDPWITDLSADQKTCLLLGYHCVADFPLSDQALAPLSWEILSKVEDIEVKNGHDTINIGLYDGGRDIRVWPVVRR